MHVASHRVVQRTLKAEGSADGLFLGREIVQDKAFSDSTAERVDKAVRELGFAPRDPQETLDATIRDIRPRVSNST